MNAPAKWFYALQAKAKAQIEEKYTIQGFLNFQDITNDRVYEHWTVIRKSDGKTIMILVVMTKASNHVMIYESEI